MDIKRTNELTGDILRHEEKLLSLKYRLDKLRNGNPCFSAKMTLLIGETRYTTYEHLHLEEVVAVLERRILEEDLLIERFKSIFEKELNEGITA